MNFLEEFEEEGGGEEEGVIFPAAQGSALRWAEALEGREGGQWTWIDPSSATPPLLLPWNEIFLPGVGFDLWGYLLPSPFSWFSLANMCATTQPDTLGAGQESLVDVAVRRIQSTQEMEPVYRALPLSVYNSQQILQDSVFEWIFWGQWARKLQLWPWCLPTAVAHDPDLKDVILERARGLLQLFPDRPRSLSPRLPDHHQLAWQLHLLHKTVESLRGALPAEPPLDPLPLSWRVDSQQEDVEGGVNAHGEDLWEWHTLNWPDSHTCRSSPSFFWNRALAGSFPIPRAQAAGCGWERAADSLVFFTNSHLREDVQDHKERFLHLYAATQGFFPPLLVLHRIDPDHLQGHLQDSQDSGLPPCPMHTPEAELTPRSLFPRHKDLPCCLLATPPLEEYSRQLDQETGTTRSQRREMLGLTHQDDPPAWSLSPTVCLHDLQTQWSCGLTNLRKQWMDSPTLQAAFTPFYPRGVLFDLE